jgi:hypothetical protein
VGRQEICLSSQQRLRRMKKTVALLLFLSSSVLAQTAMLHYCNVRFAFCIDYPSHFVVQPAPENGDGRTFKSQDGLVKMLVYGSNNSLLEKLETRFNAESGSSDARKVTYKLFKPDFFVISGIENNNVFYQKVLFKNDEYNTFLITYPVTKKKIYDPITAKISASFKHSK